MMRTKYGNKKVVLNGEEFDSGREAKRWCQLRLLERAGRILKLRRQVKYVLIPTQRDENGKLLEKESSYYADFVYFDCNLGREVVEDAKGCRTEVYRLKKKLMLWVHGIVIQET